MFEIKSLGNGVGTFIDNLSFKNLWRTDITPIPVNADIQPSHRLRNLLAIVKYYKLITSFLQKSIEIRRTKMLHFVLLFTTVIVMERTNAKTERILVGKGVVSQWDDESGWGVLILSDGAARRRFKSVDFNSGRPPRFPIVGDKVNVVMEKSRIIVIRLCEEENV